MEHGNLISLENQDVARLNKNDSVDIITEHHITLLMINVREVCGHSVWNCEEMRGSETSGHLS